MKHTLLASTAIVALTGMAAAEVTISGSARIGLMTTEGAASTASKAVGTTYGKTTAAQVAAIAQFGLSSAADGILSLDEYNIATGVMVLPASGGSALAADITELKAMIQNAENLLAGTLPSITDAGDVANGALADTTVERTQITTDIATLKTILAALDVTAKVAAVAKKSDTTTGQNRMRVKFAASGETDGGLAFGGSFKAHEAGAAGGGTAGTQYISGAFGKISMGDLNGADEQLVGDISGVGFAGAGTHQNYAYQSSAHNLAYKVSMSGVSFAASTDLKRGADSAKTGSNSAMGISWSGDMGGTTVSVGLGQSKVGVKTEDSASVSVSMGGLTVKAVTMSNDNGPLVAAVTGTTQTYVAGTSAVAFKAATAEVANNDTDTTGLSISYNMDALTVTAFTRTEDDNTAGTKDKDWSGVGFAYDLGGASLKAGFVDANDISVMDFGVTFSF